MLTVVAQMSDLLEKRGLVAVFGLHTHPVKTQNCVQPSILGLYDYRWMSWVGL